MSSINTSGQQCATVMKCIVKPICLTKLIHTLLFRLKNLRPKRVFGQNGIDITLNNDQKLMTGSRSFLRK